MIPLGGLAFPVGRAGAHPILGARALALPPAAAGLWRRFGPPFGHQELGIMVGQLQPVADIGVSKVDAVDHLGILAREPHRRHRVGPSPIRPVAAISGVARIVGMPSRR